MTEQRAVYDAQRVADMTEAAEAPDAAPVVDIDSLEGRELDAAVGKALGWERFRNYPEFVNGIMHYDLWRRPEPANRQWGYEFARELPAYSATYEGMGLVIEAMHEKGWRYLMLKGFQAGNHRHYAAFDQQEWYDANPPWFAWADSLPTAVARAALKALEGAG